MTRQVWKLDDQGRPTRLCTVETYKASTATWWQAVLAILAVALLVGAVFGNAGEFKKHTREVVRK